jgi:hypothetical protein
MSKMARSSDALKNFNDLMSNPSNYTSWRTWNHTSKLAESGFQSLGDTLSLNLLMSMPLHTKKEWTTWNGRRQEIWWQEPFFFALTSPKETTSVTV